MRRRRRGFGAMPDVHVDRVLKSLDRAEKHLSHAEWHIQNGQCGFAVDELMEASISIGSVLANAEDARTGRGMIQPLMDRYDRDKQQLQGCFRHRKFFGILE